MLNGVQGAVQRRKRKAASSPTALPSGRTVFVAMERKERLTYLPGLCLVGLQLPPSARLGLAHFGVNIPISTFGQRDVFGKSKGWQGELVPVICLAT